MSIKTVRPNIFQFGNYRSFIAQTIAHLKEDGKYSTRKFAEEAGFKGHSFLNLIIKEKRNLSKKGARRVAKGLHLKEKETEFFLLLVEFNQATDLDEKNKLYLKLQKFVRAALVQMNQLDQYELYSEWYHIPILESLSTEWEQPEIYKLATGLQLRDYHVLASFKILARLKLIEIKGESIRRLGTDLHTADEVESLFVRNFHRAMSELAVKKITELPKEEREVGGLTLPLSKKSFDLLREKIRRFNEEIQIQFSHEKSAESVYHVNLQAFPVLKIPRTVK